jgi:hypothetical protein
VLSRADTKAPGESLFEWTIVKPHQPLARTFMKRRHLTAAEKRVLSALRTHGRALRIWVGHRQDDYSWWIAGQPVTRMIYKNVPLVPPLLRPTEARGGGQAQHKNMGSKREGSRLLAEPLVCAW